MLLNNQSHSFHLVDPSPWPFLSAFSALTITTSGVLYMHGYTNSYLLWFGLILLLSIMTLWWRDIIRESTFEGQHTQSVQNGLKMGMLFFITSEVMFFFAFFWAFFHLSFNPSQELGGIWPPFGLSLLSSWNIPLLNTILLLTSGASITYSHNAIIAGNKFIATIALLITIFFAVIFTWLQLLEYQTAPFSISDGAYGSVFYLTTGFHGFHVIVGTIFLVVCAFRLGFFNHFSLEHHFGFEAAAWYWHFVDVVWLFLFITVYWWGGE